MLLAMTDNPKLKLSHYQLSIISSDARDILDRRSIYFVENLNTVFDLNVSPGFKTVVGKSG